MRLLRLSLRNFKGIRDFTLDAEGENVTVYGDNATGKTTLFDAFIWLLFDKDSQNRKDFEIKTLDNSGQALHGLEHEVEGVFEIDGRPLCLRKVYTEKWTKKRGSPNAVFSGHTTDYFIDGVPVKKNEYEARIAEIVDEKVFRLLTDPAYFSEQLHWQERRKILLDVCGDVSDEEVIASDGALTELPEILQGRSLEDHRKVVLVRRSEINKELERIPVRIDEAQRSLPDLKNVVVDRLEDDIAKVNEEIRRRTQEVARIESGGEIAEKTKRLRQVEAEILEVKNNYQARIEKAIQQAQNMLFALQSRYSDLNSTLAGLQKAVDMDRDLIGSLEAKMGALRQAWHEANAREFEYVDRTVCPTCGQSLPVEKILEAREKALAQFNREKAEKLEAISSEGKALKAKVDQAKAEVADKEAEIAKVQAELARLKANIDACHEEIEGLQKQRLAFESDPAYRRKREEKESLERTIADLKAGSAEEVSRLNQEISELQTFLRALEETRLKAEQRTRGSRRIEELKEQEKRLAAEYERLERELYLAEQFVRTKVRLLEDRINSRFKMARFKLFDTQVNGGVVECCETLYNGVPYSTALNNGARINVGLDIINTLSEHYGFSAPIFIDNAEAVTKLIPTNSQMIRLVVSERDKTMRVEKEAHCSEH